MRVKKPATGDRKATPVTAVDPDNLKPTLKRIGGSQSDDWNSILANQTINTVWLAHSNDETGDRQYKAILAALVGIGPKDELEGMIAAQLLAAHNAAMECYRRANPPGQKIQGPKQEPRQTQKTSLHPS